jgi:hypothetical protein
MTSLGSLLRYENCGEESFDDRRVSEMQLGPGGLILNSGREQLGQNVRPSIRLSDSSCSQRSQPKSLQIWKLAGKRA